MVKADRPILVCSDVLSTPTAEMWDAMRAAKLGWPLKGTDESVNGLYERAMELTGKSAAVLVPTGTMANLVAIISHAEPGDQVVLEAGAHSVWSEEWGLAHVGHVFPRTVIGERGVMDPGALAWAMDENMFNHRPRTSLVCLENTHMSAGGIPADPARTAELCEVAHSRGANVHLDGTRLFNAAVSLGCAPLDLARPADSVMLSLNKSQCGPEGAVLCGSKEFIEKARLNLRRLGGASLHKGGIIAAAGLIALSDAMITRLADDHRKARAFAGRIASIPGVSVDTGWVRTNIVMADVSGTGLKTSEVLKRLAERNIIALLKNESVVRFVFYRDIGDEDAEIAAQALREAVAG